jgi:hypothetical protein
MLNVTVNEESETERVAVTVLPLLTSCVTVPMLVFVVPSTNDIFSVYVSPAFGSYAALFDFGAISEIKMRNLTKCALYQKP